MSEIPKIREKTRFQVKPNGYYTLTNKFREIDKEILKHNKRSKILNSIRKIKIDGEWVRVPFSKSLKEIKNARKMETEKIRTSSESKGS